MKDVYHISSEFRILIHWDPSDSLSRTFTESYPSKKHTKKMNKTRHTIYAIHDPPSLTPTNLMPSWELEQHDTHKDHRENEVRTCWRVRLPKKDLYLAGCLFFLQKKRLAPLLRDFHIDIFSQPTKKWTSSALTPFKG